MHYPPPADFELSLISLFGGVFFLIVFGTAAWSMWHRRHAWGWWESPITMATALLSTGVLALIPMIFWRNTTTWWAWSYLLSYMTVMAGLGYFILALKRRQQHGPLPTNWIRNNIISPYAVGTAAAWLFFAASGAWHHPELLHHDTITGTWSNSYAFAFWIACDAVGFYSFLRIFMLLIALRKDSRRGDRGPVTVYLGSALAGMAVCVTGVLAGIHDQSSAARFAAILILVLLTFGPQVWMSGWSWRAKRRRLVGVD